MTKAVNEQVQAFQQRRLASQYAAIFLDATYLPLKRDTVQKKPFILRLAFVQMVRKKC